MLCSLVGKNAVNAKQWLDKCYRKFAPAYSTVKYWFVEFHHNSTRANDASCSGSFCELTVPPENIANIRGIVLSDHTIVNWLLGK